MAGSEDRARRRATLDAAQQKAISNVLRDFRLAGVALPEEQKQQYGRLRKRLSELGSQFSDNVLDATNAWSRNVSEEQLAVYKDRLDRSERELSRFQEQMAERTTAANPVTQGNVTLPEKVRNDLDLEISEAESTLEKIRARVVSILGAAAPGERVAFVVRAR